MRLQTNKSEIRNKYEIKEKYIGKKEKKKKREQQYAVYYISKNRGDLGDEVDRKREQHESAARAIGAKR